jgi:hypothetical protein
MRRYKPNEDIYVCVAHVHPFLSVYHRVSSTIWQLEQHHHETAQSALLPMYDLGRWESLTLSINRKTSRQKATD